MILFGHYDKKFLCIQQELESLGIESQAVQAKHPVLTPLFIIKLFLQGKKVKVFVFRYINDSDSFSLATIRIISDLITLLIIKMVGGHVWWLCHNVDKETSTFFPKMIEVRRKNIAKFSSVIFTTNQLLIPKAKEMFPEKLIDSLSLGYIETGALNIGIDYESQRRIDQWIEERRGEKSKFVFCIGSPAKKSIHFKLVGNFIKKINQNSRFHWYAVVVGSQVEPSKYIYNIPYQSAIDKNWLKNNADFYYRAIDDYSMSYSVYEAAELRIPIICENFGILPSIVEKYNLGIVINNYDDIAEKIESYHINNEVFLRFLNENNWEVAARKIYAYYTDLRAGS